MTGRHDRVHSKRLERGSATLLALRRAIGLLVLAAALVAAAPTAAALRPIKRRFGETTLPRLRAGTVQIPTGHASGRGRVIGTLKLPPLGAPLASRTPAGAASTQQ